jgi:hypothetical protein
MTTVIAQETVDEPVFNAEDDESYQYEPLSREGEGTWLTYLDHREAKAAYALFEDQVCWDGMYWGIAQPYPVTWPFLVDVSIESAVKHTCCCHTWSRFVRITNQIAAATENGTSSSVAR